jgi:hypothetical protein
MSVRKLIAAGGLCALMLAACGGGESDQGEAISGGPNVTTVSSGPSTTAGYQPGGDNTATSTTAASVSAGAPAKANGFPQTVRYADLKVTIKSVELSFAEPDSAGTPSSKTGTTGHVYAAMTLENPLQKFNVGVTRDDFRLIGSTGQGSPPVRGGIAQIAAASASDLTVAFAAPQGLALDKMTLQIGSTDRVPVQVPLNGTPVGATNYPIAVTMTASGPAHSEGTGCRWPLTVQMLRGEIDTSLGVGSGGELIGQTHKDLQGTGAGPFSGSSRRQAPAGQRVVRATMRITNHGGGLCGGGDTNISDSDFRIVVDGTAREPASFTNTSLDPGTTGEFTVAFLFPINAKQVAITVGSANRVLFTQPVTLPAVTAAPGEAV